MEPDGAIRLRELRRVVPITQTQSIGGVIVTLFSLDDYDEGFAVRLRLLLEDWHPVGVEAREREAAIHRQWEDAAQRGYGDDGEQTRELESSHEDHTSYLFPELELLAFGDRGQQFLPGYDGGHQWSSSLEGWVESRFVPPLDTSIQHVRLEVPEVQWHRIQVKHQGEVALVDRGPWTFMVEL